MTNTPDQELRQQLVAYDKTYDEAMNKNDAVALAALYREDGVLVNDTGVIYGREAIEKHWADVFKQVHFSKCVGKADQNSPHIIGTDGNQKWATGEWSQTVQGTNFGPIEAKGYWGAIKAREGGVWKTQMLTWNVTPAPAAETK
jgi:uncharacterized protein (TIGR02246 family)